MRIALRPALCTAVLFVSVRAALAADVLTPHSVATLRNVAAAEISPDGKHVAYTVSVPRTIGDDDDGAAWTELYVLDNDEGRTRAFVGGKSEVGAFDWTADGRGLAFLAKRGSDKFTSLYVIPVDGGEARRVASLASAISGFSLAPDGQRVALVATEPESEARKKAQERGFKQEVYEEDWRAARVWIVDFTDAASKPRALDLPGSAHRVRWSPVDDRLAVSLAPTPLVDDEYMRQRVHVVDAASGQVLAKIETPGKLGTFAWSPDGAHIAIVSAADVHDPHAGRLVVAPSSGGQPVELLPGNRADVSSIAWLDAQWIAYTAAVGVESAFGKVWADPRTQPSNGDPRSKLIVRPGGPLLGGVTISADGQRGAFVAQSPEHPGELFTMNHGETTPTRRTTSNPSLANVRMAKQEVVTFRARDGLELEGVLVRPLDLVKGKRYPLILYVHGGPEAHESNGWMSTYARPGHYAAARGFAVFYPNYRGSTGRGVEFAKLGQGDAAGKEFDDLVDAVDHLVASGLVDKSKVGVTGGSYGGYATAWCATRFSERFAAGVMMVGISNVISKFGTTDIPDEEFYVHALKRPWEDWQALLERSPIYHADKCKTPLLILHGKDDPRVNVGQSRELYRHLKVRDKSPVRLVLYPGEGHGNRKAGARLDFSLRMMQWFEHYLMGPGGEMPPHVIDHAEAQETAPVEASVPSRSSAASAGASGQR
ncbi:MAG: prolyl oligopeptidase family serine peptidase [Planctomycetota bacterium]